MSASLSFPGGQLGFKAIVGQLQADFLKVDAAVIDRPNHIGDYWIGPDVAGEMKLSLFLHCDVL